MANDDLKIQSLVSIDELKENMTIISYNGFHVKFKATDEKTCQWLMHNFKNTSAQIERQGKSISINISQIKQGDDLQKLFDFPNELRKLTIVTDRLIKELRSRGFLRFYVSQPANSLSIDQQEIVKVNHLIQNLKKGAQQRDTGKKVIEELLDHARGGDLNTGDQNLTNPNNYRAIRYADVLLMAAEALNRGGIDESRARLYLNEVRLRAGLSEVSSSGTALTDDIYKERRLELVGEGHRFFDLVRTNTASEYIEGFVNGKHEVFPIPSIEIDLTGNRWSQNPGY